MTATLPKRFTSESAAREFLERQHWPEGPVCPHCGVIDEASRIAGGRKGLLFCNACRKQFTVTVGTVFEDSKVPLHKWLYAVHLLTASKKGISSHQLHRMLGVTYKTAWFMSHRIREMMKPDEKAGPIGGDGKTIEADETYMGKRDGTPGRSYFVSGFGWVDEPRKVTQRKIVALVERGGPVRSFHVEKVDKATIRKVLLDNADTKSALHTDEAGHYDRVGSHFSDHQTVNHSKYEYARYNVTTNTIEGVFSIFKRGMVGTYQHCGEQHLQRYLTEFDFRYSTRAALEIDDAERAKLALAGARGKRLTYRRSNREKVIQAES